MPKSKAGGFLLKKNRERRVSCCCCCGDTSPLLLLLSAAAAVSKSINTKSGILSPTENRDLDVIRTICTPRETRTFCICVMENAARRDVIVTGGWNKKICGCARYLFATNEFDIMARLRARAPPVTYQLWGYSKRSKLASKMTT